MQVVRYRPGEALRWLETGVDRSKGESLRKAQSVLKREGARSVNRDVREAAGAIASAGAAALTELAHRQAEASEYILDEHQFTITSLAKSKQVRYEEVKRIHLDGERCTLELERGSVVIKPFAHLVAGRVRVPIGWSRNGSEVPYMVLIDELAARCRKEIELG